jgi:glycosyltransferase involved in cell wall biosynthesis
VGDGRPVIRVAYHSPLPPERSGIADYSALLLPELAKRVDVVTVNRGGSPPEDADVLLYHVGNDAEHHAWIVEALRRRPGVVVLHDFVLHHLVAGMTIAHGNGRAYLEAMEREHGTVGRLLGHGVLDQRIQMLWERAPDRFPLNGEVLGLASGLVVHSRYVEERVRAAGYPGPVWRVPHPAWPVPSEPADPGLPRRGSPTIVTLGNLNPTKRIPQLLQAFARLRARYPGALLVLGGAPAPRFSLDSRLDRLGLLDGSVVRLDRVDERRLWSLIAAADVCVSLRWPTMGETSGIALRTLSLGRPLVVSEAGWFAELPGAVAVAVPVDEWEVDTLTAVLDRLVGDERLRQRMGAAARAYAEREHALPRVADAYAALLEDAAGEEVVRAAVLREVAEAAAGAGLDPRGAEVGELAARLREVGI